ncbi:hypothetical protein SASPL_138577 [Salvia splendens]|uniref:LOB domain-containing protein n=1 Tax=Salvia splendens TaxID=180675 RepID=A0A8X8ZEI7_SALSN|nr:hypothetical protein SASPL_138577 [Salvia splendens]
MADAVLCRANASVVVQPAGFGVFPDCQSFTKLPTHNTLAHHHSAIAPFLLLLLFPPTSLSVRTEYNSHSLNHASILRTDDPEKWQWAGLRSVQVPEAKVHPPMPPCTLLPGRSTSGVHRLFGVKHIQKLLKELHPDQRLMAIKSIKFHAAMRERNPVYGCLVEVQNLASQVQLAEEELHAQDGQSEYNNLVATQDSSGSNNVNVDSLSVQKTCSHSNNNDYHNNIDSIVMQSQMTTSQIMPTVPQDYNEMYSFFDNIDDRQSYVGPKEVYESSLDSSVRDCTQFVEHMAENELKNAAACFSLTSFN